ncbi:MAG: alpha/beta fold hydrolase [Rhodoferax sp.]|nr:alpha/beta fold hydrolase [Rhodoferax sp.]
MTMLTNLVSAAAVGLALYVAVLGLLWFKQESLLFAPTVLPAKHVLTTAADIHEANIQVDGAQLSALHLRLPKPRGVVFFLHGNAGSLQTWFTNTDLYRRANFDLFMIDYRGYGKSTGRIESEAQLHADVRAAWHHVAPQYAGRKMVVYGRSLGSGLAARLSVELSAKQTPDLTVLVSPYSSMAALAAEHYGWVPAWILRYPMRTDQLIGQLRGPLVLIDGDLDQLIAPQHSQALQALAPHAKVLRIAGAAHGDIHEFDAYLDALARLLNEL